MPARRTLQTSPGSGSGRLSSQLHGRAFLRLFAAGFIVYAIIAGFGGLRLSTAAISQADPLLVIAAMTAVAISYLFAAITYLLLCPRPIPLLPTVLVQVAGGLVNRMLPAGLGGMGLNAYYLKKYLRNLPLASAVVATNNILGFAGNLILVVVSLALSRGSFGAVRLPSLDQPIAIIGSIIMIVAIISMIIRNRYRRQIAGAKRDILGYARGLLRTPLRSAAALSSSMLLTALHVAGLLLVLRAIGEPAGWLVALLAISSGAFMGAAIPTPGGLGGAEAGIAAVLAAYGLPVSTAVAAALVYRGLTYWLPLLPGYLAFRIVEKRYLY